jgi:hypothetical protein
MVLGVGMTQRVARVPRSTAMVSTFWMEVESKAFQATGDSFLDLSCFNKSFRPAFVPEQYVNEWGE